MINKLIIYNNNKLNFIKMTKCETSVFKSGVLELRNVLNKENVDLNSVNVILDQLNALDFQTSFQGEENITNFIINCCTAIPTSNSLLVAKSCNLILNHVLKNKSSLSNENLKSIIHWTNEAFHVHSDVAFLDILQFINIIIKNHLSFFNEHGSTVLPFLFEKLEAKASVLQPNEIKLWRVICLQSLSKATMKDDRTAEINELFEILYTQTTENLLFHAKIWGIIIETLDRLAPKGNSKWLIIKLNEIIGIIEVAVNLGLNGKDPLPPKPVLPSSFLPSESITLTTPVKNINANQLGKKKQKSKSKRVNWVEKTVNEDSGDSRGMKGFEVFQATTFTSDSDVSDTESGQITKLAKEQAKTRHAAFNLIIRLSNILKGKQLYGFYNILLTELIQCLRREMSSKTRIGALAAVGALLIHSKPFLAQAQHSEGTSFLPFSETLSELVTGLHSCLSGNLCGVPPANVLTPLLHTTAALLSVSPYHRLRPNLLTNIFSNIQPYLRSKDPAVCVGALKCLSEIASFSPGTNEQKNILKKCAKSSDTTSNTWVVSLVVLYLKGEGVNDGVRIACWLLVGNLCKFHMDLLEENLPAIEELLFTDLKSTNTETQLHATYALNKLLEAIITKENLSSYNKDIWLKLLKGPLISLLQSPEVIACEACDCLANMGPIIFNSLKEEEQILVITLIFGCINHEKSTVRAAAVHTLGIFLLFPQMTNEQFLYDTKDLLVKSLSDSFLTVRIKAAWAIGNLVDLINNNQDKESFNDFNLKGILLASLRLIKDDDLVKSNILRAMGLLLSALNEKDLSDEEVDHLLERSIQFLLKCSSSGSKMKMRWNACHAISTMLKNKELLPYSEKWMPGLLQTICTLIVSCNNFKVRANACTALCHIPSRRYFGHLYPFIWTSLLDGLDNAVNMPDFREYKHQDSLRQHLCSAICHITTLLKNDDLPELESVMDFRIENLREHITYFQNNTLPEQTATSVLAANTIQSLLQSPITASQRELLTSLKDTFNVVQVG